MKYAIATPNIYKQFHVNNNADFMNVVRPLLLAAGWTQSSTITGGYRMLCTSPQGYKLYCDVYSVSTGLSALQFKSYANPIVAGPVGGIATNNKNLSIACHPAGVAVWTTGDAYEGTGSYCIGGIPYIGEGTVAPGCSARTMSVNEVGFSYNDYISGADNMLPRTCIDVGGQHAIATQALFFNGDLYWGRGYYSDNWDTPQILRKSSVEPDQGVFPGFSASSHPLWTDDKDILYPAMVAARTDYFTKAILQTGQIYNAAVRSSTQSLETASLWDNYNWINFTSSYFFGGLWLLTNNNLAPGTPSPVKLGNYGY